MDEEEVTMDEEVDEEETLVELFRANDRSATIAREEDSKVTRIDGTFDLKRIADEFSTVVLRPLTLTAYGLECMQERIRAARAAGQAVDEARRPTMDDGELLAEAFRANDCFATITRQEGAEVTRMDGAFDLKRISRVFSSVLTERRRHEIFALAPRDPEQVLEDLRNWLAPYL